MVARALQVTTLAAVLLAGLVVAPTGCARLSSRRQGPTPGAGALEDCRRTLVVQGRERSYLLHVPRGYDAARPTPLVLVFHGGATNAEAAVRYTGMNETADARGFLVAYPDGTGRIGRVLTFNAGNCCGYAMDHGVDDVTFTRALLDDVARVANLDANRVYATGISNGGMMVYMLAARLSDRIAAIAPIAGTMGTVAATPVRPVSVLAFHGTEDRFVPMGGGRGHGISNTDYRAVQAALDEWIAIDGCAPEPTREALPDLADDGMRSTRTTWSGGRDGSEVVLIAIEGGGHTWPGRQPRVGFLGASTLDLSANELMWEFFERHPRAAREGPGTDTSRGP